MELYWTSKKYIHGLKHFALVNKFQKNKQEYVLMVSILDGEINLCIPFEELQKIDRWESGFNSLGNEKLISREYYEFKKVNRKSEQVNINENSPFNIS